MDIKFYYENTELTLQQISDKLSLHITTVHRYTKRNYSAEYRRHRKAICYRNSKQGVLNPMFGMTGDKCPHYKGQVSDGKGYIMCLKPEWYSGRRGSKHVFVHHVVICEELGLDEIPKGWSVHHCNHNPQDNRFENLVLITMKDHTKLHSSLKGATTISKESTLKWVEAHGTPWRDDIVCSAWEHAAAKAVGE